MRRAVLALAAILAPVLTSFDARADAKGAADAAKAQCIATSESAQQLRLEHRYVESRALLVSCSSASCPPVIRADCTQFLAEVDAALPSIVISARGADGVDVSAGTVTVDDRVAASTIDGRAIALDPGSHLVRVQLGDGSKREQRIVVREGEQRRSVQLSFAPERAPEAAVSPAATPAAGSASARGSVPAASWVLAGAGVAGIGGGVVLAALAQGSYDDLRATCAPSCVESDVDAVSTKITAGRVLVVGGVVAVVAAAIVWVAWPTRSRPSARGAQPARPRLLPFFSF